jgi:hypothetical protein
MNYDIIGDVHGHADKLEALLQKLGYQHRAGAWRKLGHTAVFVGDLIDGGPDQLRTLELVRAMVDQQCALVTMGNHEFNAIAYATRDPQRGAGYYLRPHTENHNRQHKAFLAEVGHRSSRHTEWIDWFRTLPLWLELDDLRIVHACWHEPSIEAIRKRLDGSNRITEEFLVNAHKLNGQPRCPAVHDAVETLLKGLEVDLPGGASFLDAHNIRRDRTRVRWWHEGPPRLRDVALGPGSHLDQVRDVLLADDAIPGYSHEHPVFCGHYWLTGTPDRQTTKVACVDYSAGKRGPLVAYRFEGERELSASSFVSSNP